LPLLAKFSKAVGCDMGLRARIAALRAVWEETMAINTGSFVRPLGPMLPPAPSPGWEDAADVMDPPKRRQLDSRPKKRKAK